MLVETANIIAKKLDTDETYENLFKRDKGLTDLFMEKYQSLIKLTNTSGDGYIWNPDTALWEDKPASYFLHVIQKFMESKVLFYIHKHSSGEHQDAEKIIKLTRVLDKVRDIKQAENIFKGAKGQLYAPDFQAKLNAISHLLPIKDQRVINLKTLETRDRSINDLFDFEIDIDFTDDMERYDFTDENEVTDYCKTQLPDAEKFFLQIMNGSNEIKTYLQMNLGYCLTGEINQRCIYIFWGCGSNGKSTVCDLMTKI